MGGLAGFGDHHFIASEQIDLLGTVDMLTEEDPKQRRPRNDGGEKALHGAIAPPLAGPAGEAQHRNTSSDDEESEHDPAQLA